MTARAFLVRGLLAGLLAGFATFFVAHQVGEPHVETAIALEEAGSSDHTHAADADESSTGHTHAEDGTVVSRFDQRTWGLLTGSVAIGVALGGIVALVAAGVAGRIRSLSLRQSTAVVATIGFVAVALVPFLKYPATPPAVGNADTIGARTGEYFGFLLVSVVAAVLATALAVRLVRQVGAYAGVVIGIATYLVVMVVAGQVFPTVNEIGDFPADVLWYFRRASIITLATMWGVLGVLLVGFLGRLADQETATARRRELAASL
ncbi:CbtA family protein [Nocardioides mangrovi]|uniref:CbtA family protein n=1 Tax=Nocardioides mangrovi TaxID=2874580 RepID=A0ABS7U6T3_9ACTN|nr:CbtA family protein [Nocardioides mangrovi]MBZ5736552.1 CbtA family protein [Nocardioides mangrovi]